MQPTMRGGVRLRAAFGVGPRAALVITSTMTYVHISSLLIAPPLADRHVDPAEFPGGDIHRPKAVQRD